MCRPHSGMPTWRLFRRWWNEWKSESSTWRMYKWESSVRMKQWMHRLKWFLTQVVSVDYCWKWFFVVVVGILVVVSPTLPCCFLHAFIYYYVEYVCVRVCVLCVCWFGCYAIRNLFVYIFTFLLFFISNFSNACYRCIRKWIYPISEGEKINLLVFGIVNSEKYINHFKIRCLCKYFSRLCTNIPLF